MSTPNASMNATASPRRRLVRPSVPCTTPERSRPGSSRSERAAGPPRATASRCDASRDIGEGGPLDRFNDAPSEQPQQQTVGVEGQLPGDEADEPARFGGESLTAVQDVLQCVVGTVADVGLRVDGEPRFALGGEDIAVVQL